MTLPPGKLPKALLAPLLERYARPVSGVVLGARVGEDAAVLESPEGYLVVATDPVTFATEEIGYYGVVINANDVASRGATPRWFLMTLLLPERGITEGGVEEIFRQVESTCSRTGVGLVGGHTEVTPGLTRPLLIGTMIGEVAKERLVTTSGARVGDDLFLTKGIAVEGTALLAREREELLRARGYGEVFLEKARRYLYHPGISVVEEALLAVREARVSAMHDPTEGGLSSGLYELSEAAGVGIEVERERIPILPETRRLCQEFQVEPLGLIASGALLIACHPEDSERLRGTIEGAGIPIFRIGRVVPRERGVILVTGGGERPLPLFERDEIVQVLEG